MTTANEAKRTVENSQSGPEVAQRNGPEKLRRVGKSHADYWLPRIVKRSYAWEGKDVEIPEWHARLAHLGRREWFKLTANKAAAADKARRIYLSLIAKGWAVTLAEFKPGSVQKESLSLDEFATEYRQALQRLDDPPRKQTSERYLKSLMLVCRRVGVNSIAGLTPPKVKQFIGEYLAEGRKEGRKEESVKTSCNFILRNAGAIFSRQMLETFKAGGIVLENPFVGQKLRRLEVRPYSPMVKDLLDLIWTSAATLRDGNASAPDPKEMKGKRWMPADFREPQPGAYMALLLELGLGLRRNEADKAEWAWFSTDEKGQHILEVQETPYFIPKSGKSRKIPVAPELYEAIHASRKTSVFGFIVPGRMPKEYAQGQEPKNLVYRCDQAHRVLAEWLRQMGVDDAKPCHLLRKEFGSYVATSFGLFTAQKLLGHSDPKVTSDYYAGLVDLPELKNAKIVPMPMPEAAKAAQ